ncbi:DUF1206 domain-containing protein [Ornithinimicrobium humiphilum]|uniref:Uncharacterized protein DUF1206 n=1 Tax=Ornithinimicrobium humiphilum TaxID=125288 RepID=A0A543KL07_9MICO|nr:DUF1206 domain-containing protein [Ornithinimicrobium humiphilum]TQM95741.1 uncharacterized protein DUF1206 [Ornithinimicrobium humiphilum]
MSAGNVAREGAQTARKISRNPWVERLARAGYAASGLIHVVIGVIAARVALGGSGGDSADQSGALESLRSAPAGPLLLWLCVAGFAGLALWRLLNAIVGVEELKDRATEGTQAVVYAVLGVTALSFARGGGSDGEESTQDLTATLLGAPFGRMLVLLVGATVVVVGGYHVYKGLSEKFLEDLQLPGGRTGQVVRWAGRLGYPAKGIALVIVGLLFAYAGATADPDKAGGLDSALKTLVDQPFGPVLLGVIAVGLVLYGVYSFGRARYGKL